MIKTAISFSLGCVLLLQLSTMPSLLWLWAILPAGILLLFTHTRLLAIVILGALWALFHVSLVLNNRLASELEGRDLVVTGVISSVPEYQHRKIKFEFIPDQTHQQPLPNKVLLNWYQPLPEQLNAGEQWQLTIRLKQAHGMMNPGSFDYEGWLFQQGITATGYVRSNQNNTRLAPAEFYAINNIRQSLATQIQHHLATSPHLGLVQGLTTGIRHNINQQQWQTLRLSGTSHLLAISGLHIGLVAALGFFCFRKIWALRANNLLLLPANEAGAAAGFIAALFYAALAGFSIPSQRALIMVATVMTMLLIRRPIASSQILAVSLLLIVIFDPLSVLSAGFWLSFSAVAIILFISQNRLPAPRWQWAKIHTLIALGLTPLLLLFFMQTSLIAPLANFIAVPFISLLVVPLLLLACALLWLFEPVGVWLLNLADSLLDILWLLLDYLAALPFSHWTGSYIPILYWLPITIAVIILLSPRGFPAKWLGILGFLPLLLYSADRPNKGEFWFTLLDVGQGLSAVIQTQNHTLVFDAGPKFSDRFNTGTAIVQPFLQQQNIQTIDTLIVSHGDNDHIGGAEPLTEAIKTHTILSSTPELLTSAKPCHAGQSWQWDGVTFTMLHPQTNDNASENNLSCVLQVSTAVGSVLLTGDIESKTEQLLISRYGEKLHSTILVAPHHGSKTSSSESFINIVQPNIVLFPVGYRNRYHFPANTIVARYVQKDITSFNSANHGAIQFKFTQQGISPALTWRQQNQKMWNY